MIKNSVGFVVFLAQLKIKRHFYVGFSLPKMKKKIKKLQIPRIFIFLLVGVKKLQNPNNFFSQICKKLGRVTEFFSYYGALVYWRTVINILRGVCITFLGGGRGGGVHGSASYYVHKFWIVSYFIKLSWVIADGLVNPPPPLRIFSILQPFLLF